MEFIYSLIDSYNIPLLTAFLLGVLTSVSPCPLATNITAIAYISKDIKTVKKTLLNSLFYILGRGAGYTFLATLIYFGLSSFSVAKIFEGWGDKALGPILILIGLFMFGAIKMNVSGANQRIENLKIWLSGKGYFGSLFLGALFALAFCPYSGIIFFGMLIPLVVSSSGGLLLPPIFAFGTGLPVLVFSILIAFSLEKVGRAFRLAQKFEKLMRRAVAAVFLLAGIYYTYFALKAAYVILM